nr:unnamed protein product [Digitaria exilis]
MTMAAGGDAQPATEPAATRDWSELLRDAIASVFAKLGPVDILMGAGLVCHSWLDAAMVPYLWRSVDFSSPNIVIVKEKCGGGYEDVLRAMAKKVVDRSDGQLEVFIGEGFVVDDGLLNYIGEKAHSLKVLGLFSCFSISIKGFVEAITNFPLLEELKLSECDFAGYNFHDEEAHGIATMHGLRSLKISGSHSMTNKALGAILDNCPHLESLDLHSCFNIVMDDGIRAKYAGITISVSPNDDNSSTDSFLVDDGYDYFDWLDDNYPPSEYEEDYSGKYYDQRQRARLLLDGRRFAAGKEGEHYQGCLCVRNLPCDIYLCNSMEARGDAKPATEPAQERDWSELPRDAIASVFAKLGAVDILMGPGLVCHSWLDAAMVPELWRSVDMAGPNIAAVRDKYGSAYEDVLRVMAKKAVDRSNGQLEVAPSLKVLGLISCFRIFIEGFMEAISKFPLLEELKLSAWDLGSCVTYQFVGKACKNLRHFELVREVSWSYSFEPEYVGGNYHTDEAYGITTMHGLRYLTIHGYHLTNKGLTAILDNCPQLESLDLDSSFVLDDAIRAKCAAIKISVSPLPIIDDAQESERLLLFLSNAHQDFDPNQAEFSE